MRGDECSTPFGIIEFITGKISRRLGSTFSAQRLSASSNSSLRDVLSDQLPIDGCSTPFGIIEFITEDRRRRVR